MGAEFLLDHHPVTLLRPSISAPYGWVGHIPFAYLIVDLLRPSTLVELGTDSGNSYLAFCQAVSTLELSTRCFAVDTWQGDEHARHYGEEVYQRLRARHGPLYGSFSNLLRMRFDEALDGFTNGSIDLLHIDGFHSYAAVRHDFETWLPKLSKKAVVLLHDSQVDGRDFGVARFLAELKGRYPCFEFNHAHGLAVVAVGTEPVPAFDNFLRYANRHGSQVRAFFEALANQLISPQDGLPQSDAGAPIELSCQLYYRMADASYTDAQSLTQAVSGAEGSFDLEFTLPAGCRPDFLRIDPADYPGIYGFSDIKLVSDGKSFAVDVSQELFGHVNGIWLSSSNDLVLGSFESDPYFEFYVGAHTRQIAADRSLAVSLRIDYQTVIHDVAARRMVTRQGQAFEQVLAQAQANNDVARLLEQSHQLRRANTRLGRDVEAARTALDALEKRFDTLQAALMEQRQDTQAALIEQREAYQSALLEQRQVDASVRLRLDRLERSWLKRLKDYFVSRG